MAITVIPDNIHWNDRKFSILSIKLNNDILFRVILSYLLFKNNTSFNEYLYTIYPYLLLPIPIIYVIIFIGAVIQKKYK